MTLRSEPEIRHDEPRRGMAAFRPEHWSKRVGIWFLATVGAAIIAVRGVTRACTSDGPGDTSDGHDARSVDTSTTSVQADGSNCPSDYPVKANVSRYGDRIYHLPGWEYYQATYPEECFANAEDAEDAGYRASQVQ